MPEITEENQDVINALLKFKDNRRCYLTVRFYVASGYYKYTSR